MENSFQRIRDKETVERLMEQHKFKLVTGGESYNLARKSVLDHVRRVSIRLYKLLRGVAYKDLFIFRFMPDGHLSLDLDVYGTKYEKVLEITPVIQFLLGAKSAEWEFKDGSLWMKDKGKTDKCEVLINTEGTVRITDGKDTLESY